MFNELNVNIMNGDGISLNGRILELNKETLMCKVLLKDGSIIEIKFDEVQLNF